MAGDGGRSLASTRETATRRKGGERNGSSRKRDGSGPGLRVELPVGGRCSRSRNPALFTEAGGSGLGRPGRHSVARRRAVPGGDGAPEAQPSSCTHRKHNVRRPEQASWPKRAERRETRSPPANGGSPLQASRLSHVARVLVFEMWVAEIGPKHLWVLAVRSQDRATVSLARLESWRPLTRRRGANLANGCTKLLFSRGQP